MTAKSILEEIKYTKELIASTERQLAEIKAVIKTTQEYQLHPDNEIACRLNQLVATYLQSISTYTDSLLKTHEMLKGLNSKERLLITLRYIDGLAVDEVSRRMNYSTPHIYKIHRVALDKLDRTLKKLDSKG